MDQVVEKQGMEESPARTSDVLAEAAGRAVKWVVTGFAIPLILLAVDLLMGLAGQARPEPDFWGYLGAWVLRGDLVVLAASLSAAVLVEILFFSERRLGSSGNLFIRVPRIFFGLWAFIVLLVSASLVPVSIDRYHDALNRIYADAYVPAYEKALSREQRTVETEEEQAEAPQRVHEEATAAAEKELSNASLAQLEKSYPLRLFYVILAILGLLVSSVVCGAILLALEI